jgi:hypothetical protein
MVYRGAMTTFEATLPEVFNAVLAFQYPVLSLVASRCVFRTSVSETCLDKPRKTGYARISIVAHARIVTLVFRLQVAGVYIMTSSQSIATRYLHGHS